MSNQENRQIVNQWLRELSGDSELVFSLDDNGACGLAGESLECMVEMPEGSDSFYLSASLMPLPADKRDDFMLQLLTLNMFQHETRGATLAVDPMDEHVVFCYTREVDATDANLFRNILNNFLDTGKNLVDQLTAGAEEKDDVPTIPASHHTAFITP